MHLTRRAFTLGGATLGAQLQGTLRATPQVPAQPPRPAPTICLFSKHLSTIHYAELGGLLKVLCFPACDLTRRAFTLGGATLGAQLQGTLRATPQVPAEAPRPAPTICLLSKHLATIHYAELGGVLKDLGFAGCDLTVRPGGHVEPALSAADLYRAVEAIRAEGVEVPMITTA